MLAIRLLFLVAGMAVATVGPYIAVLLAARGLSAEQIGLVAAASAVAVLIVSPIWGQLADVRLGRARTLQVAALGSVGLIAALFVSSGPVPAAASIIAFAAFQTALGPLSDALAVNALGSRRRDYGRIRLLASLGFAIVSLVVGFVYNRTGYGPLPLLWAAAAAVIVLLAGRIPDVGRFRPIGSATDAPPTRSIRRVRPGGSVMVALRLQPRLLPLLASLTLVHVAILAGFTFLALRLLQLGGQPSDVALNSGFAALGEIPSMFVVAHLSSRTGPRALIAAGAVAYAACLVSWGALTSTDAIIATRLVSGAAFGAITVSAVQTIGSLLPDRLQATGQTLYAMVAFGVAAIVANAIGGIVFVTWGAGVLYDGAAVIMLAGGLAVWLTAPRRDEVVVIPRLTEPAIRDEAAAEVAARG